MKNVAPQSAIRSRWPQFSIAEQDRRYGAVRSLMAEAGLDCIVVPPGEFGEAQAHSRYLTQIGGLQGGAWAVLPADDDATAIVRTGRESSMWSELLEWPADIRHGPGSELVADRLTELGAKHVGIIGLADLFGRPDGVIPHPAWDRLTRAVPDVEWHPANHVLDMARVVKGPEEIDFIRRITAANEAAISRMAEVARPGVTQADVWVETSHVLSRATGDWPARLSFGANGSEANAGNTLALPIVLDDGGILNQEIDARFQGYRAQCNHSVLVGRQGEKDYRAAATAAGEVFLELVDWIRPGIEIGHLMEQYAIRSEAKGAASERGGVLMHTNGLGADRPRTGIGGPHSDWIVRSGWTFTIKCKLKMNGSGVAALIGEPLTITESGAERLGKRELVPIIAA